MKVTVPRTNLLTACEHAARCCSNSSTKPILQCGRIAIAGGSLSVSATDLEFGMVHTTELETMVPDAVAVVSIRRLAAILDLYTDPDVTLDFEAEADDIGGFGLGLRFASGDYVLIGCPPDDFPAFPEPPEPGSLGVTLAALESAGLREAIKAVSYVAASKETSKWAVNCLMVEPVEGAIHLIATDTKRLALAKVPATHDAAGTPGYLLPLKTVKLLASILPDDDTVTATFGPNLAAFSVGPIRLHSRLVEGKYPPWRKILPNKSAARIDIPTSEFGRGVRQAAALSDGDSCIDLEIKSGSMTLAGQSDGGFKATADIEGLSYRGKALKAAFNGGFVRDLIRHTETESLTLEMTDARSPLVFRTMASEGFHLIMPMDIHTGGS